MVAMTSSDKPIHSLGDEAFVSLTTYRRSGEPVSTAVWIARDGNDLVVITPAESGKVKRIKNSGRVELRPCNRGGKVPDGATAVAAEARIVTGSAADRATAILKKKYGFQYRLVMLIERVIARRHKPRVILAISAAE